MSQEANVVELDQELKSLADQLDGLTTTELLLADWTPDVWAAALVPPLQPRQLVQARVGTFAPVGALAGRAWAIWIARGLAVSSALVFAAFGAHVLHQSLNGFREVGHGRRRGLARSAVFN